MPTIDLDILGVTHRLVCGDGEEKKIEFLSNRLNARLEKLSKNSPRAPDVKLLLLCSLQMESEIQDLQKLISSEKNNQIESEEIVSKTLEAVTEYVENLAEKIKNC